MEHFRVLPTEKRMKEMTIDQMEILYLNFIEGISDEELRYIYRNDHPTNAIDNSDLEELGYTEEDMVEINKAIESI